MKSFSQGVFNHFSIDKNHQQSFKFTIVSFAITHVVFDCKTPNDNPIIHLGYVYIMYIYSVNIHFMH